jgi:hypothetical protein
MLDVDTRCCGTDGVVEFVERCICVWRGMAWVMESTDRKRVMC